MAHDVEINNDTHVTAAWSKSGLSPMGVPLVPVLWFNETISSTEIYLHVASYNQYDTAFEITQTLQTPIIDYPTECSFAGGCDVYLAAESRGLSGLFLNDRDNVTNYINVCD